MRKVLFIVASIAVSALAVLVGQPTDQPEATDMDDAQSKCTWPWLWAVFKSAAYFGEVNPPESDYKRYIWLQKDRFLTNNKFLVGDKVDLYMEEVAAKKDGLNLDPFQVAMFANGLKCKRDKYVVAIRQPRRDVFSKRKNYLPSENEIAPGMLHGRLVFPKDFIFPSGVVSEDCVELQPGDCFVIRIKDFLSWLVTKKDPFGILVLCALPVPPIGDKERPWKEEWLDIRGVYKLQWGHSNIIEFEIR